MKSKGQLGRRNFLKSGFTVGVASAGVKSSENRLQEDRNILNYQPEMRYRRLGSTEIYLSVLSLGGLVAVESVYHYGIDHGVNMLHVAEDYLGGQTIETMGKVLKTRRDEVYVALKDNFDDIDGALRKLQTDHVDFIMFNRHSPSAASDDSIQETFEKYRQQGKVRFAGLTTHGQVKATTRAGIESGMYLLTMPALNQPELEAMDSELKLAQERNVGVMAMKTMKGIDSQGLQTAFLKKVLANPGVTTVLKGIGSYDMFDAYLAAAQESLGLAEDQALYRHAQMHRAENCMMCDECRAVCPYRIEVSTVLRCSEYYLGQMKDQQTALETYRSVPHSRRGRDDCGLCKQCEAACPNGIPISDKLLEANRILAGLV